MTTSSTDVTLTPLVSSRDHTQGSPDAPYTLLEFGDYECPYCGTAEQPLHQVQQELGDQLQFAFRNFPLTQIHPYALEAAEAAEAAGGQGQFWKMHDLLYQNQRHLRHEDLLRYAAELQLDLDRFQRDLTDHTYLGRIQEDVESGERSGVPGTPCFFINGVRYEGPAQAAAMMAAIGHSQGEV
ncbi:MAG: DsbA family protein [Chloroflexota bacterium]